MKDDDKTLRHFSVLFTSGNVSNLVLRFAWDLKWIDGFVRLLFRVYRPQNEWDYLTSDIKFVFYIWLLKPELLSYHYVLQCQNKKYIQWYLEQKQNENNIYYMQYLC
jgi:hypothetical protein